MQGAVDQQQRCAAGDSGEASCHRRRHIVLRHGRFFIAVSLPPCTLEGSCHTAIPVQSAPAATPSRLRCCSSRATTQGGDAMGGPSAPPPREAEELSVRRKASPYVHACQFPPTLSAAADVLSCWGLMLLLEKWTMPRRPCKHTNFASAWVVICSRRWQRALR